MHYKFQEFLICLNPADIFLFIANQIKFVCIIIIIIKLVLDCIV